ncbi:MAG: hypothetical protein WAV05_00335 [Anaerolineales bacterium]
MPIQFPSISCLVVQYAPTQLLERYVLRQHTRYTIYITLISCLILWLSACGTVIPTSKPTLTPFPSPTASITPTPTLTPTPTPQPPMAVLLAAAGADQAQVGLLQTALNDIVTQAGLRWQVRQQLTTTDLVPALRLVVVVLPDPGLADLVAAAPDTQFLALGIQGLPSFPNLTSIGASGGRFDQQGFIAGVIAAMLSDDWRVGVISLSDTVEGRAARTGFLNGVIYFCGLCRPAQPPFYEYPLPFELPSTASGIEWQEAANYMVDHYVQTVYIYPGVTDEAMLSILATAKVNLISSGDPPPSASSSWVVSLTTDPLPLIQSQVEGILYGNLSMGQTLAVPIQFTHLNPLLLTPGKQRMAEQVLSDLQSGFIDTSVDLTTGENRP